MIYIITFLISTFLIYAYEHSKRKNKIILYVALILPCLLAGLRGISVGTDTKWYPKLLFDAAMSNDNFKNYYNTIVYQNTGWGLLYKVSSFEIRYTILTYIITKIFHNFQVLLYIIQMIIIFMFYNGIKKYNYILEKKLLWFVMTLYYLWSYNITLNLIRQFIAISIVFYGISFIINNDNNKWKKFVVSLFVATMFHKSALISIGFVLIYSFVNDNSRFSKLIIRTNSNKTIKLSNLFVLLSIIICFLLLFVPFLFKNIVLLLNVEHKYINYIGTNFTIVGSTIFIIPIMILIIINHKRIKDIKDSKFYIIILILYTFAIQLSTATSQFGARISYFLIPFNIVFLCSLKNAANKKENRIINGFIIIITFVLYWIYMFYIKNYGQTIPYVFFK